MRIRIANPLLVVATLACCAWLLPATASAQSEKEQLKKGIERLRELQKKAATQPTADKPATQPAKPDAKAKAETPTGTNRKAPTAAQQKARLEELKKKAQSRKVRRPQTARRQAAKSGKGCGGSRGGPLVPSPTGPHPKLVVESMRVQAEPVWEGETATFDFNIRNEGEAELQIRLKGG